MLLEKKKLYDEEATGPSSMMLASDSLSPLRHAELNPPIYKYMLVGLLIQWPPAPENEPVPKQFHPGLHPEQPDSLTAAKGV